MRGRGMTRECIEDFREIVLPFLSRTLLKTNYENMGKSDAEEFEKDFNEVLDLAIKALEQEPCEDCISRQAVIDEMEKRHAEGDCITKGFIKNMPSVTPQEPKIITIAEIKYDKDKLKELMNKAVLTVIPQEPCDKCEVTFKDDNAVSRLSVRDIMYANAYELEYPDGSSEYVVNRDELIKYLMELPPVYSKMVEPQESEG